MSKEHSSSLAFVAIAMVMMAASWNKPEPVIVQVPGEVQVIEVPGPTTTRTVEVCTGQAPHPTRTRAVGPLPVGKWERNEEQAIKLARWCVVEDACLLWPKGKGNKKHPTCGTAGALSPECKAIVEVMMNNRKPSHENWNDTLAFMSPRMMGERKPHNQRATWVKGLKAEGLEPPDSWRDSREFKEKDDGDWRLYRDKWDRLRENMIAYWLGGPEDVCEGEPLAEGTDEDAATIAIPLRGFVRYECAGMPKGEERLWIGGPPLKHASSETISAEVASAGF
jgi:hypothetical protein